MMSRIVTHNRLRDDSLENATSMWETDRAKHNAWRGESRNDSNVQSIQLGFSHSLSSATSNEANKSSMLHTEWTITTHRAVLRWAKTKYRYFVTERCNQNAIFPGKIHQNRSYLENVSTNRWYIVGFQEGHCSSSDGQNFQLCFSSMKRMTSMNCFSDAGASHTAKLQLQK